MLADVSPHRSCHNFTRSVSVGRATLRSMAPTFRKPAVSAPVAESPERLFDDLPRTRSGGPAQLWSHQADILRDYLRVQNQPDIALELPTGAGKTLPGLLIAEWRRRAKGQRVLFAAPTVQLALQTATAAARVGIDVVTLTRSHRTWPSSDKLAYESARSIGVTTYSTVFNTVPALEPAQTLLFDDAHAAEQYVAGSWSINISRFENEDLYTTVLAVLREAMSGLRYQQLLEGEDPVRRRVQLVGVAEMRHLAPQLAPIFRGLDKNSSIYWAHENMADRLDRCLAFVSWDGILIRPVIPPTGTHRHFTEAAQRIYLSATLGDGGELERAFGRASITRLPVPEGWTSRGAGRRFFLFPELQSVRPSREVARDLVAAAGKALVLTPSNASAARAVDLKPSTAELLGPGGTAEDLLDRFRALPSAVLVLANRYDGLDLPDSQSRVTVLDGMPRGAHLQERFISETLAAGRVLRERVRTRVVQGAGRCTRGLDDYSMVVVLGDDVTRFLGLPEVLRALRPELQAELDFGFENSEDPAEMVEFARAFLAQDDAWRTQAEPALIEARNAAQKVVPAEAAELAVAARHEVTATAALWNGDWARASQEALSAAQAIKEQTLSGYRAFWLYLASAWLREEADAKGDAGLLATASDYLRQAHAASRNTSWLREVNALSADDVVLDETDEAAVAAAIANGTLTLDAARWTVLWTGIITGLSQIAADAYESALTGLGRLLGADAYKPSGPARTDSAWIWNHWWIAVEAKTEEKPDAPVSVATVRQANDQLKTLAHDRGVAVPQDSAVLLVEPRELVDPTAAVIAEPFVYLTGPDQVLALAQDAVEAWKQIRAQAKGMSEPETLALARRLMSTHRILPSDVRARLLTELVHG